MLDVGLSSTARIAAFFGIGAEPKGEAKAKAEAVTRPDPAPQPAPPRRRPAAATAHAPASGVQQVIEDALRKAGLMR
jgi:hypothetical protein